ncbi:unnamed protein product [Meganyctiphanes norvegica]|uniref:Carbohydrate sulfotransferase n=1 Tax=Meganyctiphanes norvegica TaxID=48144 RepID=A0AAV2RHM9_MEGNR
MSKKSGNKNNKKYKHNEDVTPACEDLTPDYSTDDANITVFLNRHTDQGAEWIHPTFTQFLTRVRDDMRQMWQTGGECVINKHWRPYWVSCGPCQLDYNVIAKFETLDLDNEYIIQESNLQGKFTNMHTHSANSDGFKSTSEAIKHYFSEVPVELLREIVDLYDPDFQLFEYDPQPFLNLGKS